MNFNLFPESLTKLIFKSINQIFLENILSFCSITLTSILFLVLMAKN